MHRTVNGNENPFEGLLLNSEIKILSHRVEFCPGLDSHAYSILHDCAMAELREVLFRKLRDGEFFHYVHHYKDSKRGDHAEAVTCSIGVVDAHSTISVHEQVARLQNLASKLRKNLDVLLGTVVEYSKSGNPEPANRALQKIKYPLGDM